MDNSTIATEVLRLLKKEKDKAIKRLFILLIISIVLFVASIVDSIYQRCRIIDMIEKYEIEMDRSLDIIEEEIEYNHGEWLC